MKFIKEILQEKMPDGEYKYSFTRSIGLLLTLYYIGSATYILITKNQLIDIPQTVAFMIGGVYGINKLGGSLKNPFSKSSNNSNQN